MRITMSSRILVTAISTLGLFSKGKGRSSPPPSQGDDAFIRCPACGKVLHSTIPRCPYCSAFLEVKCPNCDRTTNRIFKKCPFCEASLKGAR